MSGRATARRRRHAVCRPRAGRLAAVCGGAWLLVAASGSGAETWSREATVQATSTFTNNGGQGAPGEDKADLFGVVTPGIRLRGKGANLDLDLEAHLDMVGYARGTQPSTVLPEARAAAAATVLERLLFVDAAFDIAQVETDPYQARVEQGTTRNRRTATSARIGPYLQWQIATGTTLLLRQDESATRYSSGEIANSQSHLTTLRVDREPSPLGGGVELTRLDARPGGVIDDRLRLDAARARMRAAVAGEVVLGATLGQEHSRFASTDVSGPIYGATAQWIPSERTQLDADIEHRFFGIGGLIDLHHRSPTMSFAVQAFRRPALSATPDRGASDLRSFLDAILTTRHPDAEERRALVDQTVQSRGLQTELPAAITTDAGYLQLQSGVDLQWTYLGARDTLSLSAYQQTLRQLTARGEASSLPAADITDDGRQSGVTLQLGRQLEKNLAFSAAFSWSTIRGLAAREGQETRQSELRLLLAQQIAPRTGVSVGLQRKVVSSNAADVQSFGETSVFVGISHRF